MLSEPQPSSPEEPGVRVTDQLAAHTASRTTLPTRAGPLAALVAEPADASAAAPDDASPTTPGARAPIPSPTLVLVPGYTGSKEDFAAVLDPLRDRGIRAVAIDLPGQYESPGPDDESAYTTAFLAGAVVDVATEFAEREPVVLLGHSLGGLVARGAVLAGAPVTGLVLLCSGPGALPAGARTQALQAGEPVLREQGAEAAYAIRQDTRGAGPVVRPALEEFLHRRFVASSAAGLLGGARILRTEPDRTDALAAALRERPAGVAVIAGEDDDAWPLADQRDMARRLGTDLVLVPAAAHSPAVDNPGFLVGLLVDAVQRWTRADS